MLLRRAGQPRVIRDTKYKTFNGAPTEANRNQVFRYGHALGISRAVLLYADSRPIDHEARFPGVRLGGRSLARGEAPNDLQRCGSDLAEQLATET